MKWEDIVNLLLKTVINSIIITSINTIIINEDEFTATIPWLILLKTDLVIFAFWLFLMTRFNISFFLLKIIKLI